MATFILKTHSKGIKRAINDIAESDMSLNEQGNDYVGTKCKCLITFDLQQFSLVSLFVLFIIMMFILIRYLVG